VYPAEGGGVEMNLLSFGVQLNLRLKDLPGPVTRVKKKKKKKFNSVAVNCAKLARPRWFSLEN